MKNTIIRLFITLLLLSTSAKAMEEITTRDGKIYIGFITEEDSEVISITDENGIDNEVQKNTISDRKIVYADIYTKTGGKYFATLVNTNRSVITFKTENGNDLKIETKDFDSMLVRTTNSNTSNWQTWRNDFKPFEVPEKYKSIGIELGYPGIINASITYYDSYKSGYKFTAGIFPPKIWGCEISYLLTILNNRNLISNVFASTGLYSNKNLEKDGKIYWYLGGGADLNYKNLFVKLGVSAGFNYESGSQIILPLVTVGYVHRFQFK